MHWATPVVDRIASMRPRTFDLPSPRSRSQNVARVPRLHSREHNVSSGRVSKKGEC